MGSSTAGPKIKLDVEDGRGEEETRMGEAGRKKLPPLSLGQLTLLAF